ncbi:uncharacterized protein SPPG_07379 [Spizellomyces punctatus DAOM BR117]|uniref:DBF4-type domain-containing protein n=1 Tax=Spizellomyces punctatus (strain DAOM BR117) TaxID=645134 RepID=A0A0L0H8B6_SPIPD|nr:hypothetical protein, variant [Spizellomyces punctatus DAOM BR117]XP_016605502.1 uncharacterized protein SPPG_07379 [Spizellomyces punctatus DAOM BR117]KNC97461.1 hypothetical protein, variant [Spizellomyces punctatus DAOM BR117]KNC97462.1 hypothetical protein SPPG_07379 [Spizellomyces punctatus DAOM BR117]|eukprot:XP_016605501.1 hypothetical protein, variant [Spizellomyces punctatus DAOM BR117]
MVDQSENVQPGSTRKKLAEVRTTVDTPAPLGSLWNGMNMGSDLSMAHTPEVKQPIFQFTRPHGFASSISARGSSSTVVPTSAAKPPLSARNTPLRSVDYRKNTPPWPTKPNSLWPSSAKGPSDTPVAGQAARKIEKHTPATPSQTKKPESATSDASRARSTTVFATPRTPSVKRTPGKSKGTSAPATQSVADKAVALAQFKGKIKNYRFFFDCFDNKVAADLSRQIKELGGTVELFMNKSITHLVTNKPIPLERDGSKTPSRSSATTGSVVRAKETTPNRGLSPGKLGSPSGRRAPNFSASRGKQNEDNISIARKFGAVVWSLDRLVRIFKALNGVTVPRRLQDHLRDEKLYGLSTNRDPEQEKAAFRAFKSRFVLVEDALELHKPILMKEYKEAKDPKNPPWPIIFFKDRQGRCAFVRYPSSASDDSSTSVSDRDGQDEVTNAGPMALRLVDESDAHSSDTEENDLQRQVALHRLHGVVASAASGLISGSTAVLPKREPLKDAKMTQLGQRELVVHPRNKPHIQKRRDRKRPQETLRRDHRIAGKAFYNRPGYCENCNIKYDVFAEHIESKIHKSWLRQANFQELDNLIASLQRPPKSPRQTKQMLPLATSKEEGDVTNVLDTVILEQRPSATMRKVRDDTDANLNVIRRQSLSGFCKPSRTDRDNPFLVLESQPADGAQEPNAEMTISASQAELPSTKGALAAPAYAGKSGVVAHTTDGSGLESNGPTENNKTFSEAPVLVESQTPTLPTTNVLHKHPTAEGTPGPPARYPDDTSTQIAAHSTEDVTHEKVESSNAYTDHVRVFTTPQPSTLSAAFNVPSATTPIHGRHLHLMYDLNTTSSLPTIANINDPTTPFSERSSFKRGASIMEGIAKRSRLMDDGSSAIGMSPLRQQSSDLAKYRDIESSKKVDNDPGGVDAEKVENEDDEDEVLTVGSSTPRANSKYWPRSHSDFLKTVLNAEDLSPKKRWSGLSGGTSIHSPTACSGGTPRGGSRQWSISSDGTTGPSLRRSMLPAMNVTPLARHQRLCSAVETPTKVVGRWVQGLPSSTESVGASAPEGMLVRTPAPASASENLSEAAIKPLGDCISEPASRLSIDPTIHENVCTGGQAPTEARVTPLSSDNVTGLRSTALEVIRTNDLCTAVGFEPISSEPDDQPWVTIPISSSKRNAQEAYVNPDSPTTVVDRTSLAPWAVTRKRLADVDSESSATKKPKTPYTVTGL